MFQQEIKTESTKQSSISLTACRALTVLAELLKNPCSKERLNEILSNEIYGEGFSKDTLRRTLNALKNAGCVISRPTEKNGYKYSLISHPFSPDFSMSEINFLNIIRKNIALQDDYKFLYKLNKLYSKIILSSGNNEPEEQLNAQNPFSSINEDILEKFISGKLWRKVVEFSYFSANAGLEDLKFVPDRISMKNSKLYVYGYCFKYNQYAFLNLERIKAINSIYELDTELSLPAYEIVCRLTGISAQTFKAEKNEEIIEQKENEIKVKMLVADEFVMFQRLLPFGSDLKSISPDFAKERFVEKLRLIRRRYFE